MKPPKGFQPHAAVIGVLAGIQWGAGHPTTFRNASPTAVPESSGALLRGLASLRRLRRHR